MQLSNAQHRWHAIRLIYRQELAGMLWGPGIYIVASLSLLGALLLSRNYMGFVIESGLVVLSGAFNFPLFLVIFLAAVFLALSSVTTIARERDAGTIEVLFYGPIDSHSYILGKFLAQIVTYIAMLVILTIPFWLFVRATNFTFPVSLGWVVFLSLLVVADVIAFSIFLSAFSSKVRSALAAFLAFVLLLIAIQFGDALLAAIPIQSRYYNPVLILQDALALLRQITQWLSPFAYLMRGMEAVRRGDAQSYLLACGLGVLFTFAFLSLAVEMLSRKGVRQ